MRWLTQGLVLIFLSVAVWIISNLMGWSDLLAYLLAGIGVARMNVPLIKEEKEHERKKK